ncbi:hypothetical protein DM02DRAFT_208085 [Periconia macrospinosa]|uniref:Zn(2)-C6 fungal-type domain-containing protein n=1 Tax=Periconia macrospinosa TaxID=97972 RepID=A0A2V1E098_9PLEO|nr:hypothetical protein DM02DRAFT_208085 [Periconia macrospinosa]
MVTVNRNACHTYATMETPIRDVTPSNSSRRTAFGGPRTRNPNACERCHSQRKRCYLESGKSSCVACYSNGHICQARRKMRMGRRPVAQRSIPGSGTYSIIGLEPNLEKVHAQGPPNSWTVSTMDDTENTGHHADVYETLSTHSALILHRPMSLASEERKFFHTLQTREGFFQIHRPFLIGETFADDFQKTLTVLFYHAPNILTHAYQATLGVMAIEHKPKKDIAAWDLTLGSQSLQSFRKLSTSSLDIEDAAVVLMLGQILLAYNTVLWIGATRTITRGTLLAVQHCYPGLRQRPEYDCVTINPVLIDIVDCLLRREVPVLRPPESTRCTVDRCCGVLSSLLPLLYDLCHCSYAVKTMCPGISAENPYADIERRIKAWSPAYPPDFFKRYSPCETKTMMASASIYRQTALLVAHRLRFPLGAEDKWGEAVASNILDEVSPLSNKSVDGATGLNMDFPLLVATVELPDRGAAVARLFEPLRFCKAQLESNLRFVGLVRKAREEGFRGSWLDLVDGAYVGDILP